MLSAWHQSPGMFVAVGALLLGALVAFLLAYLRNRGYRHVERMRAMELNRVAETFFAGRLMTYIPWQFWTSFVILLVLVASALVSAIWMDDEVANVFLELSKYVTGAVIGSLFGTAKERDAEASPQRKGKVEAEHHDGA